MAPVAAGVQHKGVARGAVLADARANAAQERGSLCRSSKLTSVRSAALACVLRNPRFATASTQLVATSPTPNRRAHVSSCSSSSAAPRLDPHWSQTLASGAHAHVVARAPSSVCNHKIAEPTSLVVGQGAKAQLASRPPRPCRLRSWGQAAEDLKRVKEDDADGGARCGAVAR